MIFRASVHFDCTFTMAHSSRERAAHTRANSRVRATIFESYVDTAGNFLSDNIHRISLLQWKLFLLWKNKRAINTSVKKRRGSWGNYVSLPRWETTGRLIILIIIIIERSTVVRWSKVEFAFHPVIRESREIVRSIRVFVSEELDGTVSQIDQSYPPSVRVYEWRLQEEKGSDAYFASSHRLFFSAAASSLIGSEDALICFCSVSFFWRSFNVKLTAIDYCTAKRLI